MCQFSEDLASFYYVLIIYDNITYRFAKLNRINLYKAILVLGHID